jgi:FkbM family methyltransferase
LKKSQTELDRFLITKIRDKEQHGVSMKTIFHFISRIISGLYPKLVRGTYGQRLNDHIFQLALRGRGFNNCCDMVLTGEAKFLELLSTTRPLLCVDIGANVGNYSKALIGSTNAKIFAFEPLPDAFFELEMLRQQFPERIRNFQLALGNTRGISTLYFGDSKSELASLSREVNQIDYVGALNTSELEVQVDKLDSYLEVLKSVADEIDFLKIDVEGFEWEVLQGAQKVILDMSPKFIQLEFNIHQLFRGQSLFSLSQLLPNYKVFQLLPNRDGMVQRDVKDPLSNVYSYSNYVFVRSDVDLP